MGVSLFINVLKIKFWLLLSLQGGGLGMPVFPLVSGRAIEQEGSKFLVSFPLLKREFSKNTI